MLRAETKNDSFDIKEGEAIIVSKGEWIRYSSPDNEGAEYIAVCLPAFSIEKVHRDE
jgi:mannose-6-phosphate isomerase-like protein (cupin superfamily)